MIFRSLQLGLEFAFQMWEQKRRQEGKQKMILESKSSFQAPTNWNWVAQIVMPTKEAQSNLKQESSICCKNKQANEEEGKPERGKPPPSSLLLLLLLVLRRYITMGLDSYVLFCSQQSSVWDLAKLFLTSKF